MSPIDLDPLVVPAIVRLHGRRYARPWPLGTSGSGEMTRVTEAARSHRPGSLLAHLEAGRGSVIAIFDSMHSLADQHPDQQHLCGEGAAGDQAAKAGLPEAGDQQADRGDRTGQDEGERHVA